jgi:hypothetical protein
VLQYVTVFLATRLGRTFTKENSLLLNLLDGIFTHNHDKDVQTCSVKTEGSLCTGFVQAMINDDAAQWLLRESGQ